MVGIDCPVPACNGGKRASLLFPFNFQMIQPFLLEVWFLKQLNKQCLAPHVCLWYDILINWISWLTAISRKIFLGKIISNVVRFCPYNIPHPFVFEINTRAVIYFLQSWPQDITYHCSCQSVLTSSSACFGSVRRPICCKLFKVQSKAAHVYK